MAKRKFGRYAVDISDKQVYGFEPNRYSQTVTTVCTISGDIEIGIHIEIMTWREDWLFRQMFSPQRRAQIRHYRITNISECYIDKHTNKVTAEWFLQMA